MAGILPFFSVSADNPAPFEGLTLTELERRLSETDIELEQLARYSLRSGLGSIGYRSRGYPDSKNTEWVQIELRKGVPIDEIVLVPTILRDTKAGFIDEGFPSRFRIIAGTDGSDKGRTIAQFGPEDNLLPRIAPFVISFPEIEADWVRIEATELSPIGFDGTNFLQFSEVFVFSGQENVALRRPVTTSRRPATDFLHLENVPQARNKETLVDGFVPYLMDAAVGDKSIAFLGLAKHESLSTFLIDLEGEQAIDRIHLHAVEQSATVPVTSSGDVGIPKRLTIEGANQLDFSDARLLVDYHHRSFLDAGPIIMLPFTETRCRYVRLTAETGKGSPSPTNHEQRVGFAEIEILRNGVNQALEKPVQTDLKPESFHRQSSALTDGLNFYGRILTIREWMNELARRHDLETERPLIVAELNRRYTLQKANLSRMYWLAAALAAGIVFTILIDRIIRLRQVSRIKERFAADLHDELGANLHTIGLLGDVAQSSMDNPERLKTALQRSRKLTEQTSAAVRHCMSLQDTQELYGNLPDDIRRAARRIMTGIESSITIKGEDILNRLSSRCRSDLFLFYKECLVNICRHSGASRFSTFLKATPKEVQMTVSDNGCGLPKSHENAVPKSLARRAKLLKAKVIAEPSPEGGTSITLSLRQRRFRFL